MIPLDLNKPILDPFVVMVYICWFSGQNNLYEFIYHVWKFKRGYLIAQGMTNPKDLSDNDKVTYLSVRLQKNWNQEFWLDFDLPI